MRLRYLGVAFGAAYLANGAINCLAIEGDALAAGDLAVAAGEIASTASRSSGSFDDCSPYLFGDANDDGWVNLSDFAGMQACFTGPGTAALDPECEIFDVEPDGDIDTADYAAFRELANIMVSYRATPPACSFNNSSCTGMARIPLTVYKPEPASHLSIELAFDENADGSGNGQLFVLGDVDDDGDVDLADIASFQRCFTGQGPTGLGIGCNVFDVDDDSDVDLFDYEALGETIGFGTTAMLTAGEFPIGDHAVKVLVRDSCDHEVAATIPFSVADCKAPTPICINGLAINLNAIPPGTDADGDGDVDEGAFTIWATDFLASPITDCSGPVAYSISRSADVPDVNQSSLVLTCDDGSFADVRIYAWDQAINPITGERNHDYCETFVLIDDSSNLCGP